MPPTDVAMIDAVTEYRVEQARALLRDDRAISVAKTHTTRVCSRRMAAIACHNFLTLGDSSSIRRRQP